MANASVLWVTGGYSSILDGPLDSTEWIDVPNNVVKKGPNLPQGLQWHCAVKLNEHQVMLTGGMNGEELAQDQVYLFDYYTMNWQLGPALHHPRYGHSCGSFYNETSLTRLDLTVVVVGGQNPSDDGVSRSMERINLMQDVDWSAGKPFFDRPVGSPMKDLFHRTTVNLSHWHWKYHVEPQPKDRCDL